MHPLDNYFLLTWFACGAAIVFLWIRSCFYCHHIFNQRVNMLRTDVPMIVQSKMYMVTFVLSVLLILIASVAYMVVAYNYQWLSKHCCCGRTRRRSGDECERCGQEINTVSRHAAELRNQMNEMPPEYSKVGGLPPAYDIVMAGNPPAYNDAIKLEINSTLRQSLNTSPHEIAQTDLSSIVITPTETVAGHTGQSTSTTSASQASQIV